MTNPTIVLEQNFFESLINMKHGNKEFVFGFDGDSWFCAIGNRSAHVSIGEAITYGNDAADITCEGSSAVEVLLNLRHQLKTQVPKS